MGLLGKKQANTFRPRKQAKKNTRRYDLHKQAQSSLGTGENLKHAVKLPEGEDENDWIADHVVDFYNSLNLLYSSLMDDCTINTCPTMTVGRDYECLWVDNVKYKKPTSVPAPEYIELTMDWVADMLDSPDVFPEGDNAPYPKNFRSVIKKIMKRIFRVYAHLLNEHYRQIRSAGIEAHINTSLKHFMLFVFEFDLLAKKEAAPMSEWIINNLGESYRSKIG
eukprot:gb/GECH01005749.1/.p1 GENE.gb/GECH01005749.1/~~gb/GECH01005749.1/.p1  ORF type:complete len:222 (+),score=49.07 gb/GECH01005749.1/:1-666(+)